jgi:ataxia telangiectasia mutated family protein
MTADIVDGMGISGTAGVFQRCAEETLRVLRDQSGVIMTVLEVFKHDPLHSWTVSEIKMKQLQSDVTPPTPIGPGTNANDANFNTGAGRQMNIGIGIDMTSGSADEAADRALSSVARKLDKSLSVQSTVNELIAEATDPMNLASLFVGETFVLVFVALWNS